MASYGNDVQSYRRFLDNFCQHLRSKRRSTGGSNLAEDEQDKKIQLFYDHIVQCEVEGECLEWIRQYLDHYNCPSGLTSYIARCACDEMLKKDLSHLYRIPTENNKPQEIDARALLKEVIAQVHEVCLLMQGSLPKFKVPDCNYRVSVSAIRNFRRKMEDRHIVLPDLNSLFALKGYPSQSYYAVYDGHSGVEAAVYTMTHLHCNMVHNPYFSSDAPCALKYSYKLTDKHFLEKSKREKLKSGSTGITALIRGSTIYVSWLGDSQAVLVRNSQVIDMTMPHTPARQDEKKRIEDLGGIVLLVSGISRVNGNISVSRAIGDADQKPCISSDADVITYEMNGSEDYLMLACDGAWDYLEKKKLPYLVYNHVQKNNGQFSTVAESLIKSARENGSKDNISVIVVFFKEELSDPHSAFNHAVRENGENQKHDENPNDSPMWGSNCDASAASSSPQQQQRQQHQQCGNPTDSNGCMTHESESKYDSNTKVVVSRSQRESTASSSDGKHEKTFENSADLADSSQSSSLCSSLMKFSNQQPVCSCLKSRGENNSLLRCRMSGDVCLSTCSKSNPRHSSSIYSNGYVSLRNPLSQWWDDVALWRNIQLSYRCLAFAQKHNLLSSFHLKLPDCLTSLLKLPNLRNMCSLCLMETLVAGRGKTVLTLGQHPSSLLLSEIYPQPATAAATTTTTPFDYHVLCRKHHQTVGTSALSGDAVKRLLLKFSPDAVVAAAAVALQMQTAMSQMLPTPCCTSTNIPRLSSIGPTLLSIAS
ncbi:protein phosphatase 1E [Octopus bimaculoides]|uniref:protein phosphatase 1E n=1 Tax=Octopus bimaculoides TaxID=37653 RepID=UPI00071D2B25|nr:protein phosphatase 1E [Octopus bimaculoides]|eukprot:XP_014786207.1 PREDICTED: protein phosphatase 1E-like [Octopus bimaculoides]